MKVKTKIKQVWNEHKTKIIGVGVVTSAVIAGLVVAANRSNDGEVIQSEVDKNEDKPTLDYGRDCLMTFTVEETGEDLGTIRCTETYVKDWKDSGLLEEIIIDDYNMQQYD